MQQPLFINSEFIDRQTNYPELVEQLKKGFSDSKMNVPMRHHHDFPVASTSENTTMLLMPAWHPENDAGIKIVTVHPENYKQNIPTINGTYVYLDSQTGIVKAILEAKTLTNVRTAASSALASTCLSRKDATSLLMIGTGSLAPYLIKAHASVRPIKEVFVWGRNLNKAKTICNQFKKSAFKIEPIANIYEKMTAVDIISCATFSKDPLIFGEHLRAGQHIDLVGSYKPNMREADDVTIQKSNIYLDTYEGGLKESGDIVQPLLSGILKKEAIKGDLFQLCGSQKLGRQAISEITLFKSVGHALEDLVAARYYYDVYVNLHKTR